MIIILSQKRATLYTIKLCFKFCYTLFKNLKNNHGKFYSLHFQTCDYFMKGKFLFILLKIKEQTIKRVTKIITKMTSI